MSIGSFILIKNEAAWIGPHLASWLPFLDEMVFYDGNSSDGTLEIIGDFIKHHEHGNKIKLFKGMDPKDLKDDYVNMFNQCMWEVSSDFAFFLHPDMIPKAIDTKTFDTLKNKSSVAFAVNMESYAGDPGSDLFLISEGRGKIWKSIYRLRNPNLDAHYYGHYGDADEDVYFKEITGNAHIHYGDNIAHYPYNVEVLGLTVMHFSDVRPYGKRLSRMVTSMETNGRKDAYMAALIHPRVSLLDGYGHKFEKAEYPSVFASWKDAIKVAA